ncbi:hypothetical protein D3C71_1839570 [compost metagenome]
MKLFIGVLLIFAGFLAAGFFNIFLLIKGIVDIVNHGALIKGLIEIFIREIVGGIIAFVLIVSGAGVIASNK